MEDKTNLDESFIPMNPRAKVSIISKMFNKVSASIQKLVFNIYEEQNYPFYLACRNTFVFLRKNKVDHFFEKNTHFNEFSYSIIFMVVLGIISIKGCIVKLNLAKKAEFYLDNEKEINEGFVYGTFHTKANHIKY